MPLWNVDFLVESHGDVGREVSLEVEADTCKEAMIEALTRLEVEPGETLHMIHAHIGIPH